MLVPGGRADVAVKCPPGVGEFAVVSEQMEDGDEAVIGEKSDVDVGKLFRVAVSDGGGRGDWKGIDLSNWTPPEYPYEHDDDAEASEFDFKFTTEGKVTLPGGDVYSVWGVNGKPLSEKSALSMTLGKKQVNYVRTSEARGGLLNFALFASLLVKTNDTALGAEVEGLQRPTRHTAPVPNAHEPLQDCFRRRRRL